MKTVGAFRAADRALWIVGAATFLASAIATAPADVAAGIAQANAPQLKIAEARGTFWKGVFSQTSYAGAPIGDVAYTVNPLGLLSGRVLSDLKIGSGALLGNAKIEASPSRVVFSDVSAEFNLAAIRRYTFFGAHYQGAARIKARRLSLSPAGCVAEEATFSTDALDALTKQFSGEAFPVAGDLRCEKGNLVVALIGDGVDAAARIDVSVAPDLAYTMTVFAEPRRAGVKETLRLLGFEGDGRELSWRATGRLKGLSS